MYSIVVGENIRETQLPRSAAITAAKQMSQSTFSQVRAVDERGRERLIFRRGQLLESTFVTVDRQSRRGSLS